MAGRDLADMLEREAVANRAKHWVRAVTACNSKCLFCLDADTPRNVYLPREEVEAELRRGREALGADKVIISGGEASLHPLFPDFIRTAREMGYARVQTVTNGYRFADRDYYKLCMDAGLGEITFSLHGHTAALHDHLTQTPGAFDRLLRGMVRALRDPRGPIVNVDVVINKQNVGVIDKIVELCIGLGVTEFDLLHVIPQANAYDNRDDMFYAPREHLPRLHKVFALNRHPRFVVWTNRFPVSYLEGMEDLIQDPHKMLDEVNGRRFMVRNYLDTGKKLECRDVTRCVHCFIEPFCTTMDDVQRARRTATPSTWELGTVAGPADLRLPSPLPPGVDRLALHLAEGVTLTDLPLPSGLTLEISSDAPGFPATSAHPILPVVTAPAALDAALATPPGTPLRVVLDAATAPALLGRRDALAARLPDLLLVWPTREHLREAAAGDLRDPAAFFTALALPIAVTGLPACATPGARPVPDRPRIGWALFDAETGRIDIQGLARHHVRAGYHAKSERCADCAVSDRCKGFPINMVRDQGLRLCRPLGPESAGLIAHVTATWPDPLPRVADGRPLEAPAPSLPGYPEPAGPVDDPLALIAAQQDAARAARARARAAGDALPPVPFGPRG